MELTDRERRILAEMEHQLSEATRRPPRRWRRPRWTVVSAAVLGGLLLAAGAALDLPDAVILGGPLLGWSLWPLLWSLLRAVGRFAAESLRNLPPGGCI